MTNRFMIKFAWKCEHEDYGEILSFIVTPKINTYANTYGYDLSLNLDEVIRFQADHPKALAIIRRLARVNATQWVPPTLGDIIVDDFNLDDFFDEYYYQDNYGRDVTFHTHKECFNNL